MQPNFNDYSKLGGGTPLSDPNYVMRLREELYTEYQGLHIKMKELEEIRYLEGDIPLGASERTAGLEIRTGLSNDLVEKVKAALTTNLPTAHIKNLREGGKALTNAEKREKFWNAWLIHVNRPVPILSEIVDAQAGLGFGVPKLVYYPWPRYRKQGKDESNRDYINYTKGKKREWGPPFVLITVHPLSFMPRYGAGNHIDESIEESYKNKKSMFQLYGIDSDAILNSIQESVAELAATEGVPTPRTRSMAAGKSTSGMVKVTEYCRNVPGDSVRQVFIEDRLVFEETDPSAYYFPCLGRTTSSKDPDKLGVGVADILRTIEPTLDRVLTRMAEASDLVVRKRLAVELPEGSTEYLDPTNVGQDNNPEPRTFEFSPELARALPPGAKIQDPFEGVENVYGAMPFIQLIMQIAAQHGVSPIFKGIPPGAGGSGYRDNSLYLMARSQFSYMVENYQFSLSSIIEQAEKWIVERVKRPVLVGPYELKPSDIEDWPAEYDVKVEPFLPQNLMAEAQLYDEMWSKGHVTRRTVREKGLQIPNPMEEDRERLLEDLKAMLKPVMFQDVLRQSGILPAVEPAEGGGLVGPDGRPLSGEDPAIGQTGSTEGEGGARQGGGQQRLAAISQQGSTKQPPKDPGELRGSEGA